MSLLRYALVVSLLLLQFKHCECRIKWNPRMMSDDQSDSREDGSDEQALWSTKLDDAFDGDTYFWPHISENYVSSRGWDSAKQYHVTMNPGIRDLLNDKLLVGSLNTRNDIGAITLTFYDMDDNILQDPFGQRLQYESNPDDLGHLIELMPSDVSYSYAKFLFTLISDSDFDPTTIFFHFSRPSSHSSKSVSIETITFSSPGTTTTASVTFTSAPTTTKMGTTTSTSTSTVTTPTSTTSSTTSTSTSMMTTTTTTTSTTSTTTSRSTSTTTTKMTTSTTSTTTSKSTSTTTTTSTRSTTSTSASRSTSTSSTTAKTATSPTSTTTARSTSMTTTTTSTVVSATSSTTAATCVSPYVMAPSGSCVNIHIDFNNCGTVGYNCSSNYTSCSAGVCSIAPGVQLANANPICTSVVDGGDDYDDLYNVTLPFSVTLYNTTASVFTVTNNGVLCLGGCSWDYRETTLPATPYSGVTVFPYWDDLNFFANSSQGIYYAAQGTAPNRTLIFEYYLSHFDAPTQYYQFQVLFFEAQPNKVQYKYYVATDGGASCTIGVQASSAGPAIQYSFRAANSVQPRMVLTFDTRLGTYNRSTF